VERIRRLQARIKELELEGALVAEKVNCRYLTGFTGTRGYLVVSLDDACLFTDFRYVQQARGQAAGMEVREIGPKWVEDLHRYLTEQGIARLGLEKDYISYQLYALLAEKWQDIELSPVDRLTLSLREIKDAGEEKVIQESVDLADRAFQYILPALKAGAKERDISLQLEFFLRNKGAEDKSFDFIVASGERSAMPHGVACAKELAPGDLVTMDFGGIYQGYCSDITRTVVLGKAGQRQREVYELVAKGQEMGIKAVRPGVTGKEVDAVVRDFFAAQGYAGHFGHGLGHGVGMEIHEIPRLSPEATEVLQPGMVVTVEPGLYIEGFGGVRIEDMVLVTPDGCRVLTKSRKDLIEL
jgi:Xaa-Pro aminopeptidase